MSKDQPNVQNISVNLIDPPEFNSRTDRQGPAKTQAEQKFQQLLSSMEADGQLQAIEVEGPNDAGRYLLNLGSRRLRAAIDLDWPTIRAEVRPYSDARTRILRNFKENLIRDDLTQFEMSRALLKLRDGGHFRRSCEGAGVLQTEGIDARGCVPKSFRADLPMGGRERSGDNGLHGRAWSDGEPSKTARRFQGA